MKKLAFLAAAAVMILAASCSNKSENAEEAENLVSVDSIVANAAAYEGDTIVIEGVVSHLCKHGGTKAFLLGSDDNTMIRCDATPEMGGYFPPETIHKALRVMGVVTESRITPEMVDQMEEQYKTYMANVAKENGQAVADTVKVAASGCETERKAQSQENIETYEAQIADYRARIAEREAKEGKPYLSSYYVLALDYEVIDDSAESAE